MNAAQPETPGESGANPSPEQPESAVDQAFGESADAAPPRPGQAPAELQEELEQLRGQVLRVQAELENFRKRSQREMEQQRTYANLGLVRDLAPAIDNLQRAVDAAADDANSNALRDGVRMVVQLIVQTLAQHGCRQVGSVGESFDPNFHEAVGQEPSQEFAKGVVLRVLQVGYVLHDRVVRPAHVFVSSGPPAE